MPLLDAGAPGALQQAAERLAAGELLAFPTETVYGLGARADDDAAVSGVFALKGRPPGHPLIVHVAQPQAIGLFAAPPGGDAQRLIAHFWPGPLTLILPRLAGCATAAAGGQPGIGLRMPSHSVARRLLDACARLGVQGVAAPSANRFGRISPTTAAHVQSEFGAGLWVLDGGPCAVGIESAIVDCTGAEPALLRPGGIDRRSIEAAIGRPLAAPGAQSARAPGTLASHYAPTAPLRVLDSARMQAALAGWLPRGLAVYSWTMPPAGAAGPGPAGEAGLVHRRMPGTAAAVAHELFAVLREFDARGAALIWVEQPPSDAAWDGVRDRLQRASAA